MISKTFKHIGGPPLPKLEQVTLESGSRYYVTETGEKYTSVTTFLSSFPNPTLERWKKRVGQVEAESIRNTAARRGTMFHNLVESYLFNSLDIGGIMPDVQDMFNKIRPILERIDNIHFIETHLYSDVLRLAGQVDLIAEFDGIDSIIDHKTSRKPKRKEWIEKHFLQETCYSLMYEERTGIKAKQLVTIINVEDSVPQIFVEQRKNMIPLLAEKLKEYRSSIDTGDK